MGSKECMDCDFYNFMTGCKIPVRDECPHKRQCTQCGKSYLPVFRKCSYCLFCEDC